MTESSGLRQRAATVGRTGVMMARSGLLKPGTPVRMVGQLSALRRWGTVLGGSFVSAAARDPHRPAIIDERGSLTFAEVDARTDSLAGALDKLVGPARIAVLCRNHRGMVESLIACSKLGADVVLLNTGMSTAQLLAVLEQQEVKVLIVDTEFTDLIAGPPAGIHTVTASGSGCGLEDLIASTPATRRVPPKRAGRTIVLSSGTTGRPKGADRQPRPGIAPLASMLARIPLRVHDTMMIEAPLFHTWGYAALQLALGLRCTLVLRARFDPEACLRTLQSSRATVLIAVPIMLQRILDLPTEVRAAYDLPTLRIIAVSGSALPGGLATGFMNAFGDLLYNLYGSTESSWVTIATPADLRAEPDTAGTPPPGTRLAILDQDGKPVPAGTVGRIFAANELLFAGYTSGATKEMHEGLMSLGDMGHIDGQGRLFVHGRDDDMIVSGGENVFPSAVEEAILQLPQVHETAVIGVPDEEFGQRLAAYLVLREGQTISADELRIHIRERVARFAVPRDVHFIARLPRNATGKIVRRELPAIGQSAADTP